MFGGVFGEMSEPFGRSFRLDLPKDKVHNIHVY